MWRSTALAILLLAQTVQAATLEVRVVDEQGSALAGETVTLRALQMKSGPLPTGVLPRADTDFSGRVSFPGLAAGTYSVNVPAPRVPGMIPPEHDPAAPSREVVLNSANDVQQVELRIRRGVDVVCRLEVSRGPSPSATARFRQVDSGVERAVAIERSGRAILPPGAWQVSLETEPGLLFESLEIDGLEVDGPQTELELAPGDAAVEINWSYRAQARLEGEILFDGPAVNAEVKAHLIAAGDWGGLAAPDPSNNLISTGVDRDGRYSMTLPAGVWEVTVEGRQVQDSYPPYGDIELAPGEDGRLDFEVSSERLEGSRIEVTVFDPRGARISGSWVELWPMDEAERGDEPVAAAEAGFYAPAKLDGVPDGDYIAVVGHPAFVEGRKRIPGISSDKKYAREVRAQLKPAGTLLGLATGIDGAADSNVTLVLEREDGDLDVLLADPELREKAMRVELHSDERGNLRADGVWPGRYLAIAEMNGEDSGHRIARFRAGSALRSRVVLEVLADRSQSLRVTVLPAATLEGAVTCIDAEPPEALDIAVLHYPQGSSVEPTQELLLQDVAVADGTFPFEATPLPGGDFGIAVRPAGREGWMSVVHGNQPRTFTVSPGEQLRTGLLPLICRFPNPVAPAEDTVDRTVD